MKKLVAFFIGLLFVQTVVMAQSTIRPVDENRQEQETELAFRPALHQHPGAGIRPAIKEQTQLFCIDVSPISSVPYFSTSSFSHSKATGRFFCILYCQYLL